MVCNAARGPSAPPAEPVAQRPAGDVLHREIDVPPVGALVVDRDHIRMRECRRGLGLAGETPDELVIDGEVRMHDFEGHGAVELGIVPDVHRGHSAARDPRLHPISPVEQLPDEGIGDGRVHWSECMGTDGE